MSRSWYKSASDSSNLLRMRLPWRAWEAVKIVISAIFLGMSTIPDLPLKAGSRLKYDVTSWEMMGT